MRAALVSFALVAVVLSGCASKAPEAAPPAADFKPLDLQATSTTGVIRGVVVDSAIRPVVGAAVTLRDSTPKTATTQGDGAFGFDGLQPGTYFLSIHKGGFLDVQQSADVVAGVADPAVVKVQLVPDASFVAPYAETYILDGFIECGVTTAVVAYAACSQPNGCQPGFGVCAVNETVTNDNFNQFIPLFAVPQHIQHEVVWDATQSTGNMFSLAMRTAKADEFNGGGYHADIGGDIIGGSPLVGIVNATMIDDEDIGEDGLGLAPAVFAGGMEGTQVCQLPVGCTFATGATVEQKFSLFTNIFYGYQPPEGWLFAVEGSVPPPPL
jgi:hypothetical protein